MRRDTPQIKPDQLETLSKYHLEIQNMSQNAAANSITPRLIEYFMDFLKIDGSKYPHKKLYVDEITPQTDTFAGEYILFNIHKPVAFWAGWNELTQHMSDRDKKNLRSLHDFNVNYLDINDKGKVVRRLAFACIKIYRKDSIKIDNLKGKQFIGNAGAPYVVHLTFNGEFFPSALEESTVNRVQSKMGKGEVLIKYGEGFTPLKINGDIKSPGYTISPPYGWHKDVKDLIRQANNARRVKPGESLCPGLGFELWQSTAPAFYESTYGNAMKVIYDCIHNYTERLPAAQRQHPGDDRRKATGRLARGEAVEIEGLFEVMYGEGNHRKGKEFRAACRILGIYLGVYTSKTYSLTGLDIHTTTNQTRKGRHTNPEAPAENETHKAWLVYGRYGRGGGIIKDRNGEELLWSYITTVEGDKFIDLRDLETSTCEYSWYWNTPGTPRQAEPFTGDPSYYGLPELEIKSHPEYPELPILVAKRRNGEGTTPPEQLDLGL